MTPAPSPHLDALLSRALAAGLNVALPLGPRYQARAPAGARVRELAGWARGGVLLLSGGDAFFDGFRRAAPVPPRADPLDVYTRDLVESLLAPLRRGGLRAEARYPFYDEPDPLPFRRIALAAGVGALAPTGLFLHRRFGSWLAARALVLLDEPVGDPTGPDTPFDPCVDCAAPCVPACPAGAVSRAADWDAAACTDLRRAGDPCADGCGARLACPLGETLRYGPEALRFFQAASRP